MGEDTFPEGDLATDSGPIIELLESTPRGQILLERILGGEVTMHCSWINIAEVTYILCRKVGHPEAKKRVDSLLASGYLIIEDDPSLHEMAAEIKCDRAIALPDCYSIAVASTLGIPVLFAGREGELVEAIRSKPFKEEMIFLDDLASFPARGRGDSKRSR